MFPSLLPRPPLSHTSFPHLSPIIAFFGLWMGALLGSPQASPYAPAALSRWTGIGHSLSRMRGSGQLGECTVFPFPFAHKAFVLLEAGVEEVAGSDMHGWRCGIPSPPLAA